jgi:competence protein ComEA
VPVRLDPGRRAAAAVGLAVLVAALLTGLWLVAVRPRPVSVSATAPRLPGVAGPVGTGAVPTASAAGVPLASAPASVVVVDVAGRVRRPGLYRLPAGSRVDDAVKAAGGPVGRVDLSSLNLAARLVDGQQVLVGTAVGGVAAPPAPLVGSAGSAPAGAAVDLNAATVDQLESLPGIGPVLAQHIVDWRTAHGGFVRVDQLNDVSGIGAVKFAALRGLVTV